MPSRQVTAVSRLQRMQFVGIGDHADGDHPAVGDVESQGHIDLPLCLEDHSGLSIQVELSGRRPDGKPRRHRQKEGRRSVWSGDRSQGTTSIRSRRPPPGWPAIGGGGRDASSLAGRPSRAHPWRSVRRHGGWPPWPVRHHGRSGDGSSAPPSLATRPVGRSIRVTCAMTTPRVWTSHHAEVSVGSRP